MSKGIQMENHTQIMFITDQKIRHTRTFSLFLVSNKQFRCDFPLNGTMRVLLDSKKLQKRKNKNKDTLPFNQFCQSIIPWFIFVAFYCRFAEFFSLSLYLTLSFYLFITVDARHQLEMYAVYSSVFFSTSFLFFVCRHGKMRKMIIRQCLF